MNEYNSISPFLQTPLQPNNIIIYKASSKLQELPNSDIYGSGLRPKSFGKAKLLKHTFKNGVGILKFDKDVTEFGERAFYNSGITEIKIPSTVIKLKDYSLYQCQLTSIDLPDNLQSIGNSVFNSNKIDTFIIPDNVVNIGGYNFYQNCYVKYIKIGEKFKGDRTSTFFIGNYSYSSIDHPVLVHVNYNTIGQEFSSYSYLYMNVVMGSNVQTISSSAFSNTQFILSVTIGNNVKSIGYQAFYYCENLQSVNIPSSVTSIEEYAFYYCRKLKQITIGRGIKVIPRYCFYYCGYDTSQSLEIIIPSSVIEIGEQAFCYGNINKLTLPNKDTKIGYEAFANTKITNLEIPDAITTIGVGSFRNSSITTLKLSKNLKTISIGAFNSINIRELIIPEGVENLSDTCFAFCQNLESVQLPTSIRYISITAFLSCPNLTYHIENGLKYLDTNHVCLTEINNNELTVLNIEANTTAIYSTLNFMVSDSNIEYINVDSNNPVYDSRNNCNAIIETATNELILGCGNTVIPEDIVKIRQFSFKNCKTVETIVIPTSVTFIGWAAFRNSSLQSIEISSNVTDIDNECFLDCNNLVSVNILSNSITYFKQAIFKNCSSLISINLPNSLTGIGPNVFEGCTSLTSIVIPEGVINIREYAFYNCTNLASITIPSTVINIGEDALMETAWLNNQSDGPVYINNMLYYYAGTLPNNTTLTLDFNVTRICAKAFQNQSNLISVVIPEDFNSIIEQKVFYNCSNLTTVTINNTSYMSQSFNYTTSLKNIFGDQVTKYIIGNNVTTIKQLTFYDSKNLETIELPETLTTIESDAFANAEIVNLTIPSSVTSNITSILGVAKVTNLTINCNILQAKKQYYSPFKGTIVSKLIIGEGVTSIGNNWFYNKTFTTLELPSTITSLGSGTFNCSNLTNITVKATTPPPANSAFKADSSWINAVTIYVPAASVNAYKNANGWSIYRNRIQAIPTE